MLAKFSLLVLVGLGQFLANFLTNAKWMLR